MAQPLTFGTAVQDDDQPLAPGTPSAGPPTPSFVSPPGMPSAPVGRPPSGSAWPTATGSPTVAPTPNIGATVGAQAPGGVQTPPTPSTGLPQAPSFQGPPVTVNIGAGAQPQPPPPAPTLKTSITDTKDKYGAAPPVPVVPGQPAIGAVPPARLTMDRVPQQAEIDLLPPGSTVETPLGTVSRGVDGATQFMLNAAGQEAYRAETSRLVKGFSNPFAGNPNAPQPPVVIGKPNFDPISGRWVR